MALNRAVAVAMRDGPEHGLAAIVGGIETVTLPELGYRDGSSSDLERAFPTYNFDGGLMTSFKVNRAKVRPFVDAAAFNDWLAKHHDEEAEVWIKIYKVHSGRRSISPKQAIDVALCWGWIDAIRKPFDEESYLQRYTPRGGRSTWSQINVDNVARLIKEGRMTEHGLRHVEAAKADGRWARAYKSGKEMKIPDDLQSAIDANPRAKQMLCTLSEQNRFAMAFRTHNMKTLAGRKRKIATFVAMLERGETLYPQRIK